MYLYINMKIDMGIDMNMDIDIGMNMDMNMNIAVDMDMDMNTVTRVTALVLQKAFVNFCFRVV